MSVQNLVNNNYTPSESSNCNGYIYSAGSLGTCTVTEIYTPPCSPSCPTTCGGGGESNGCGGTCAARQACPPGAPSCTMIANPNSIMVGQSSTLLWNCSNVDSCSMDNNIGSVSSSSSVSVSPASTTDYTLSCTGPGGSATTTQMIAVASTGPSCSFVANPGKIVPPQASTLSWNCENTTSCSINQGIGSVNAVSGSTQVTPAQNTTYTLSCNNSAYQITTSVIVASSTVIEITP